jgi:hypothetical protein
MRFGSKTATNALLLVALSGLVPLACLTEEEARELAEASQELSTTRLEAEVQTWSTSSGDSVDATTSTARFYANATGDFFQFSQSVAAGQYDVVVRYATRSLYGKYRLDVNGAAVGNLDGTSASSSDAWTTVNLGAVSLSGSSVFRFVSTGTATSDYDFKIDYVELQPTSTTTASSSSSVSSSSVSSSVSSSSSSSGAGGGTPEDIELTIPTPTNGSGEIRTATTVLKNAANGGSNLYDFGNQKIGVNNTINCETGEGQKTVFEVEHGVTVKNLIIAGGQGGLYAGNGIVCKGDCTLDHVYWEDVCEDAATLTKDGATMTLNHVIALKASDKVFQHNAKANSKIEVYNSYIYDFGKLWRSCGDCTNNGGPRHLVIDNVKVEKVNGAVAGANQNYGDTVEITNLFVKGWGTVNPKICTEYIGVTDHNGSSTPVNGGASQWNTATCKVLQSDVTSW